MADSLDDYDELVVVRGEILELKCAVGGGVGDEFAVASDEVDLGGFERGSSFVLEGAFPGVRGWFLGLGKGGKQAKEEEEAAGHESQLYGSAYGQIWSKRWSKNTQIVAYFVMLERLRASYIDLLIV